MVANVRGTMPLEEIVVDAVAVEVAREECIAISLRPIVAQVHHGAGMRMAAAGFAIVGTRSDAGQSGAAGRGKGDGP